MNERTSGFSGTRGILLVSWLLNLCVLTVICAEGLTIGPLFNIAATDGGEGALSTAFDGTNFLVAIQGDAQSDQRIGAQLVGPDASLIGSLITTGRTGGFPFVAFGGGNYLMAWTDDAASPDDIYGQLISTSGALVGSAFPISTDDGAQSVQAVAFNGSRFLVVWLDDTAQELYGRFVSTSGSLLGSRLALGDQGHSIAGAVASDGQDFLLVWHRNSLSVGGDYDTVGRIIHTDGSLEAMFVISETPSPSYNPVSVAYNGSHYLVVWNHDTDTDTPNFTLWDVLGRCVSTDGTILGDVLSLASGDGDQVVFPGGLASDQAGFLLTWSSAVEWMDASEGDVYGRYLGSDGSPQGDPILIAGGAGSQVGCGVSYGAGKYLCVLNDNFTTFGEVGGDVLGAFVEIPLAITVQPETQTVAVGDNATFSVVVDGGTSLLGYLWQVSTDSGSSWTDLANAEPYSGVTTATLTVSGATSALSRYQFRCVVSDTAGTLNSDAALLRVAPASATLSGSDDFSNSEYWSAPTRLVGEDGSLSFANGRLEHLLDAPSDESAVLREWTSNVGSYTQDWSAQVDVHLASLDLSDELYANLNLIVVNAATATNSVGQGDSMGITFHRDSATRFESQIVAYYDDATHDSGHLGGQVTSATDASLRITFDSTTKELSSWYDADGATGGYSWTLHHTANIGGGEYTWDMTDSSTFVVMLVGAARGVALTSGQAYFDNFQASATGETVLHDWNDDGIVSIIGDVPAFVRVVYFQDYEWYEEQFPGRDPVAVGDCNGDGILSIIGDVPCFVECVYFGDCGE